MVTQTIGQEKRSRMSVALVALALALVVFVLATQASSIWSKRPVAPTRPVPAQISVNWSEIPSGGHPPTGCRVKFGCQHGWRIAGSND